MQIKISTHAITLNPKALALIEKKIGGLKRFLKNIEKGGESLAEIEVSQATRHHKSGKIYYAEGTLRLPKRTLRAEASENDATRAIDRVKDILKNEMLRYKDEFHPSPIHQQRRRRDVF